MILNVSIKLSFVLYFLNLPDYDDVGDDNDGFSQRPEHVAGLKLIEI